MENSIASYLYVTKMLLLLSDFCELGIKTLYITIRVTCTVSLFTLVVIFKARCT